MSDFDSKMPMHSQDTPRSLLEAERQIIMADLGLRTTKDASRLTFSDEGWSSRAYLVDGGDIVYKFPRSPEVLGDYEREMAALALLASTDTPLPVQRVRAGGPGVPYLSMHGLVGPQLSERLATLDDCAKADIGVQLGGFLRHLHGLDMPNAPEETLDSEVREYQAKYQLATQILEEQFTKSERSTAADFFLEELPAKVRQLGLARRLCHGDLGSYNIVLTADGTPGIIDFGNIGYYDQSKDFIDFNDATVLNASLESYGSNTVLQEKITLRMIALQAIDLVYYMTKKDKASVAQTADKLKAMLAERQGGGMLS